MATDLDRISINTIRMLAIDMVEKANSGHPGMPMGAAPMAYTLFTRFLRHNPKNPEWPDRDRFILSAGHGSALLYALLYLTGYDLSMDEIKNFRQWESKTPGHPEYGDTPGVEATTGPLGQGFGMGVGMAMAERFIAGCYNRTGHEIVNHFTYAIVSDGDLMEGVASEAASLAGRFGLGKIIYLYDDNHITIEGETGLTFTEDVAKRFEAYGWHVIKVADGEDIGAIGEAIRAAQGETERPSLICVRTHIGYGSPRQDSPKAHGEPLGADGVKASREFFGWPEEPDFFVPEDALAHFRLAVARGQKLEEEWLANFEKYSQAFPGEAARFEQDIKGELPGGWADGVEPLKPEDGPIATRAASGKVLNALADKVLNMLGGSADLAPSTKTILDGYGNFSFDEICARNIHFGVREHGMGAIVNGMALHRGVIPYGATFLIFSDYLRPSLRLAALMGVKSIFVFTHDSVGVGEDGPTHQPVEHLMSIRAIPNLTLIRPADAGETLGAWFAALKRPGPTALALTRQKLPVLDPAAFPTVEGVSRGAYVLSDSRGAPDLIIMATGSEVALALAAKEELSKKGVAARVVSMPSWEIFEEQPEEYRDSVLPPGVEARLAVEAGATLGWYKYVGTRGRVIGVDRFGASAPGPTVMEKYGLSAANVVAKALELAGKA